MPHRLNCLVGRRGKPRSGRDTCSFVPRFRPLEADRAIPLDDDGGATRDSVFFSMPLTLAVGIAETFAGVTILVPRFRRWGAWLVALLLIGFMLYFAINYSTLAGKDCSCFPWVKRAVSPAFFVGDGIMLVLAAIAGFWAGPPRSLRSAAVVLGAIVVFAGVFSV